QEVRTEAVFETSDPLFDQTWVFVALSYDAVLAMELVDASSDKVVGRCETSVRDLMQ
ncbi:unnamed protein product, partial [Choristocarpus tenellus]